MQPTEINELAAALAKAQAMIEPAPKDADNPYFKSKYASLPAVREAMRDAFAANGLSVVQIPSTMRGEAEAVGQIRLKTLLLHSSGQYLDCGTLCGDVDLLNPQKMGSAITYFRRYSLAAISQTVADDDDDGNAASGKGHPKAKPKGKPLSDEQVQEIELTISEIPDADGLAKLLRGRAYQRLKTSGPSEAYARVEKAARDKHAELTKDQTDD